MVGKRKRQDTLAEGEGNEVNGDNFGKLQQQFHEWLLDVLVILRE